MAIPKMTFGSRAGVRRHVGSSLPLRWSEEPQIGAAVGTSLVGGWLLVFSFVVFTELGAAGTITVTVLMVGIAAVSGSLGLWLAGIGIGLLFRRTFLHIDRSTVRFREKGLNGVRADWTEPLSAFQGVVPTRKHRSYESDRYTDYVITLKHGSDRKRDVELYRHREPARVDPTAGDPEADREHRVETESFATLLALPVLVAEEDGSFSTREVTDLDTPLAQRVAEEGRDAPRFDPAAIPSRSALSVRTTAGGYVFEASLMRGLPWALLVSCLGLWLLYLYFGPGLPPGEGSAWVVPVVGGMFAVAGLAFLYSVLFTVERLMVSPRGLRITTPMRPGQETTMTADEIEDVGLRKTQYGRFRLTIEGDTQRIMWGWYLSTPEANLVRDAIIQTLVGSRKPTQGT